MSGVGAPDNKCEICESAAEFGQDWAVRLRKCPRCGTFLYHGTMDYASKQGWPSVKTPDHMVRLSGWVRDQNDAGVEYPNITLEVSLRVAQIQLPGLRDRANRALGVIAARWPSLDSYSAMQGIAQLPEVQGRSYSATLSDAMILVRLLTSEGLLDLEKMGQAAVKMSIKGLLAVEALGASLSASPQGFVAMSFDERL